MARHLIIPAAMRDAARTALRVAHADVPDVAYRLAAGWCYATDRRDLALWCLDNPEQYTTSKCSVTAALRGGRVGKSWATAAAGFDDADIERLLNDAARSDAMLVPQLSAAITVAWERTIDHANRKARGRLSRSTEGRAIDFTDGFPNRDAAVRSGVDDLMDRAWDTFAAVLTALLGDYARTQSAIVAQVDPAGAQSVDHAITAKIAVAVAAVVAFLDNRARAFILGDTPFEPQEFMVARSVVAWVSGASGEPAGFTFVQLSAMERMTIGSTTTAQQALMAASAANLLRTLTWVHGYFGEPIKPFEPHVELDGSVFTIEEATMSLMYPSDHVGCRCALVPSWQLVSA